jgi:hypothetical protein
MPERRTEAFAKEEWAEKEQQCLFSDLNYSFIFPSNNK